MKINQRITPEREFSTLLITQPNQAFTPRQILEQFARNEVVPTMNQSTDALDDSNYSEDELLESDVIEFEDEIEAQSYINENQFRLYEEKQQKDNTGDGNQVDSGGDGKTSQETV